MEKIHLEGSGYLSAAHVLPVEGGKINIKE